MTFDSSVLRKAPSSERSAKDEGGYETKPERELFRKINLFIVKKPKMNSVKLKNPFPITVMLV